MASVQIRPPSLSGLVVVIVVLFLNCIVEARDFVIGGYLPEYRSYIDVNATTPFLTDLVLFSVQPSSTCCLGKDHFRLARQAQVYKEEQGNGELTLWVSVGGGGRSDAFSGIANDLEKRAQFIHDLIELCNKEGIQGVDFDWEVPRSQRDQEAYAALLVEAANKLHKADLFLSVALHPNQFMPQRVYDEVDRIHFMAYDLEHAHVAHYDTVMKVVQDFIQSGCPASKMILGLPAYGRHFQSPGLVRTFAELMDDSKDQAISRNVWNGYQYETPSSIRQKVEYAVFNRMGGVFFWELGQDKQHDELGKGGILLEAAANSAKQVFGEPRTNEL